MLQRVDGFSLPLACCSTRVLPPHISETAIALPILGSYKPPLQPQYNNFKDLDSLSLTLHSRHSQLLTSLKQAVGGLLRVSASSEVVRIALTYQPGVGCSIDKSNMATHVNR